MPTSACWPRYHPTPVTRSIACTCRHNLPRLFACYYSTRDEKDRVAATQFWEKIQAELHFDGQKDLLDHLGDTIILHNDPPHPLKLPLAFTSLIEIRGDAKQVRRNASYCWRRGKSTWRTAKTRKTPAGRRWSGRMTASGTCNTGRSPGWRGRLRTATS
jgi:hypothetical protein